MGAFSDYTENLSVDLDSLFNRSIKAAMTAGIVAAVKETKHDSSNAAVHWLVGVEGAKRSSMGPFNRLRDLRGRLGRLRASRGKAGGLKRGGARAPKIPQVGYRGDKGRHSGAALSLVRSRAKEEVLERIVRGRNAPGEFFFFNAAGLREDYSDNANLEMAGMAAVNAAIAVATRYVTAGMVRKRLR